MLLNLPTELTVQTLACLKAKELLSFSLISRQCRDIVANSLILQYIIELHRCGMEQFRDSNMNSQSRIEYLLNRESNWSRLSLDKRQHISTPFNVSGLYDLGSGVFILGEKGRESPFEHDPLSFSFQGGKFHSLDLSLQSLQEARWRDFELEARIIDIGLAIEEHDLIAAITSVIYIDEADGRVKENIGLYFIEYSTGRKHGLATQLPLINISEYPHLCENAFIEIVGNYVALLLTGTSLQEDMFLVFNWMTGEKIFGRITDSGSYGAPIFVDAKLLVISNLNDPSLELYLIIDKEEPNSRTQVDHIRSLGLPVLSHGSRLVGMLARADPNVNGSSPISADPDMPKKSYRIFPKQAATIYGIRSVPERAIILFHLILNQFGQENNFTFHEFSFVVHRYSLLELAFSDDLSTYDPVPWEAWGPPVTSWDVVQNNENPYITSSSGQRHIIFGARTSHHLAVRDYNIYAVKQMLVKPHHLLDSNPRVITHERAINHSNLFAQSIRCSLPYVEVRSERSYAFDSVIIDDHRIIGLSGFEADDDEVNEGNELDVFTISPYDITL